MSPTWHLRLFRTGVGRCEDRKYDQHFLLNSGTTRPIARRHDRRHPHAADGVDRAAQPLGRRRSGRVAIANQSAGRLQPDACGNPAQRKRFLRNKYNRLPLFVRPFLLFVYRYFFRLGFLDGTEGLIFWVLQTFWFRFLVDAKIWESRHVAVQGRRPLTAKSVP